MIHSNLIILTINAGSSSIKYQLFDMDDERTLFMGTIESIGHKHCRHTWRDLINAMGESQHEDLAGRSHRQAFHAMANILVPRLDKTRLDGIGHRVVHGAEYFSAPTMINAATLTTLRTFDKLAPLHNPMNLLGIDIAQQYWPDVSQVAIFDTGFFSTLPEVAYLYGLPYAFYTDHQVRRYGFHGISHQYVAQMAAEYLQRSLTDLNLVTLHLGNGVSVAAIKNGQCIDTTMGMTPLGGVMMGTRCGDLDPSIIFHLARTGLSYDALETVLNKQSGLKGICGTPDIREIHQRREQGDDNASRAFDLFCYPLKKTIGAYYAVLGEVDALVFTGGIGENDPTTRAQICAELQAMGIAIDTQLNEQEVGDVNEIHQSPMSTKILVIPTNETLAIARCTRDTLNGFQGT